MSRATAATSSAAKTIARVETTNIQRVLYEDGTSDLTNVTMREPEGLRIVGGGTLPSPLSVELAEGWSLIRDAKPIATVESPELEVRSYTADRTIGSQTLEVARREGRSAWWAKELAELRSEWPKPLRDGKLTHDQVRALGVVINLIDGITEEADLLCL